MAMAVLRQHVIVCSDCPSAYRFSSDAVDVLTRASPSVFGKALPKAFPGAGTLKARRVIRSIYFPPGDESVSAQKGGARENRPHSRPDRLRLAAERWIPELVTLPSMMCLSPDYEPG